MLTAREKFCASEVTFLVMSWCLVFWEKRIGWRQEGRQGNVTLCLVGRRMVLGAESSLRFSVLGGQIPSFPFLPSHLAACWRGVKESCSYRNERSPMQNASGATGVAFSYPLLRWGSCLIPVHFGRERRKMNSSFSDWCLHWMGTVRVHHSSPPCSGMEIGSESVSTSKSRVQTVQTGYCIVMRNVYD